MTDWGEAFAIAGTGIGLVFLTIVVFTFVMMGLTRLFPGEDTETPQPAPEPEVGDGPQADRRLAAAMAVGLALAIQSKGDIQPGRPTGPSSKPSAWKLHGREELMRSRMVER